MKHSTLDQIKQKLIDAGWYPERSEDQAAKKEWEARASLLAQEGILVDEYSKIKAILKSYIRIEMELWNDDERYAILSTEWSGQYIKQIVDLSKKQDQLLFPIGKKISFLKVLVLLMITCQFVWIPNIAFLRFGWKALFF
jgi:hypothetical protein